MQTEGSIEIVTPIDEFFYLTTRHVTEWSEIVVSEELIEETTEGVGMPFRSLREDYGHRTEFDGIVTDHDAPHFSTIAMMGPDFHLIAAYTFEDLAGRTHVTQVSHVYPQGVIKQLFFGMGWL